MRVERRDTGLRFGLARSSVEVTVCSARIVRVSVAEREGSNPEHAVSYVEPRAWSPPPIEITEGPPARLATSDLRLEVGTDPFGLIFTDAAGEWLLREPADGGMAIERGADGATRVRARFAFSGEQHFYGLGQGGGRLDRLG